MNISRVAIAIGLFTIASARIAHAEDYDAPPPQAVAPVHAPALSGWHDGLFYVRDVDDNFRLYLQGRVHVDFLSAFGPGVSSLGPDSAQTSRFTLRRARPELSGEFFKHWQWQLSVDLAPSAIDNPAGNVATTTCSVDPNSGTRTCTNNDTGVDAAHVAPAPTDAFINYIVSPQLNFQVGQYLIPFSFENRMSDNTVPYLERSLAVRTIGAPNQRDMGLMAWGETENRVFYYSVGVFNGDGPNRFNVDSRFDGIGRAFVRPLAASTHRAIKDFQIGFSMRDGSRDPHLVGYDMPLLTTQGGFPYWKPTYKDSLGRTLHILPSGMQEAYGADIYLPVEKLDLTGEFIYINEHTREAVDGYQLSPFTERFGALTGYSYYASLGYWIVGNRSLIGFPSYGKPNHVDLTTAGEAPSHGLEALAKVEQVQLKYGGSTRGGVDDSKTPDGDIKVDSATFGLNYWATHHVRVSANYGFYLFPSSEPVSASTKGAPVQTADNRALAPAQLVSSGTDNSARDGGHVLHEISMRVGIQF